MKSKEIVNEGLSPVLYHSTSEVAVRAILHSDEFMLSATEDNIQQKSKTFGKYPYYMSFSRSRSNEYVRMSEMSVILTIDGRRLATAYSGGPIDYFHYHPEIKFKADEMEDRLLSKNRTVGNAGRYIRLIEVLLPSYWYSSKVTYKPSVANLRYYEVMVEMAAKSDIPVYFYTSQSDFLSGNRKNSLTISELQQFVKKREPALTEDGEGFNSWVVPSDETLKREYKVEIELKGRDHLFQSEQDFIDRVKAAPIVSVSASEDRIIKNRSRTRNKEELIDLVSSYRSWPEFRNMKTVDAIYQGFENNSQMELPIVIKQPGRTFILTGNTRMDIAFQMGITPKVLMVEL